MTPDCSFLLRCDASGSIGTGHVMRCLALAQACQDAGGRAIFAMAETTPAIEKRLTAEGFEIVRIAAMAGGADDARQTVVLAGCRVARWVVIDGYQFGGHYQDILKEAGLKVLFVDDYGHAGSYPADIVLNQNVYAHEALYANRGSHTVLLLGCRYAMLRREFGAWRGWQREVSRLGKSLLVTMGGGDPNNITQRILEAIPPEDGWETTVVVGGTNPHLLELDEWIQSKNLGIRLRADVVNMPDLMAGSDLAIAAAGTTSWEMCFLGLPALLVVTAENQRAVAEELGRRGAAINLGWGAELKPSIIVNWLRTLRLAQEARRSMSDIGRHLVDGLGAKRVVLSLRTAVLRIRDARVADCRLLWEWANDRAVRDSSFSPDPIGWEDHCAWLESRLQDHRSRIYLAFDACDVAVGQVRFDEAKAGEAEIDISLDRAFRGIGLAPRLIEVGCRAAFETQGIQQLHAHVRLENIVSARAFEKAGFTKVGAEEIKGKSTLHYVLRRS